MEQEKKNDEAKRKDETTLKESKKPDEKPELSNPKPERKKHLLYSGTASSKRANSPEQLNSTRWIVKTYRNSAIHESVTKNTNSYKK